MDTKISMDSKIYTDIQGLKQIQYNPDEKAAKKEVAQQFESMLMQMMLSSMRKANKVLSSDLFGSNQMEFYQDMYDKQLSLSLSGSGIGLADIIEKNMEQQENAGPQSVPYTATNTANTDTKSISEQKTVAEFAIPETKSLSTQDKNPFATQEEFVKKLWSSAKAAASLIGASPEILLAQAALETNWGKNIVPQNKDASSHNLFNIKADNNWNNKTGMVDTLEQRNGVLVKEKSSFRSYESFKDSFVDYVNLLKQNDRYSDTVSKAPHPEQFAHALQDAGYATDQAYGDKIMKIFSSHSFKELVTKVRSET